MGGLVAKWDDTWEDGGNCAKFLVSSKAMDRVLIEFVDGTALLSLRGEDGDVLMGVFQMAIDASWRTIDGCGGWRYVLLIL